MQSICISSAVSGVLLLTTLCSVPLMEGKPRFSSSVIFSHLAEGEGDVVHGDKIFFVTIIFFILKA